MFPRITSRIFINSSTCPSYREISWNAQRDLLLMSVFAAPCCELVDNVSGPLILNKTMTDGCLPGDWKKACVSPIYKTGANDIASNYWPISLTSIVCKLMESILNKNIMGHLKREDLLSSKQFGFNNKRSTTTHLLSFSEMILLMEMW